MWIMLFLDSILIHFHVKQELLPSCNKHNRRCWLWCCVGAFKCIFQLSKPFTVMRFDMKAIWIIKEGQYTCIFIRNFGGAKQLISLRCLCGVYMMVNRRKHSMFIQWTRKAITITTRRLIKRTMRPWVFVEILILYLAPELFAYYSQPPVYPLSTPPTIISSRI